MSYSFQLAAKDLLYASSHRQDRCASSHRQDRCASSHRQDRCASSHRQDRCICCYTGCGPLAGTRNSSMGTRRGFDPTTHHTMSGRSTIADPVRDWSFHHWTITAFRVQSNASHQNQQHFQTSLSDCVIEAQIWISN